ncbi:hypothetical protein BCF33_2483 [Hasllibacter halocynthiae]|uniref:Uncharacterized protein n=1 Tax=Hasllibacter halocynthiae TaxID=595589 RepID=A0A2T0X3S3_9RHOB|nr:hypothetical protein [Hasllibacter halocynthiae]PRY93603.1 hypothetical protein BCF33_2483 [Hasllibacter halocynthiae]
MRTLALCLLAALPAAADAPDLFRVACLEGAGSAALHGIGPVPLDAPPDVALHPEGAAVLLSEDPEGYGAGGPGPHLVLMGDAPRPLYCAAIFGAPPPGEARAALADVLAGARHLAGMADPRADHFLLADGRLLAVACPAAPDAGPMTVLILNDPGAPGADPAARAALEGLRAEAAAIPPGLPAAGTLRCVEGLA